MGTSENVSISNCVTEEVTAAIVTVGFPDRGSVAERKGNAEEGLVWACGAVAKGGTDLGKSVDWLWAEDIMGVGRGDFSLLEVGAWC